MAGDSIGNIFRVTNWGESHGPAVGCVVEGCPAGLPLTTADIQPALDRRRPGQSEIVTQRNEGDKVEILSGVVEGITTGTPISLLIKNSNQRSKDYSEMAQLYRPSHADYTYQQKYGIRDVAGGGRSSARTTAANVAAGAIAEKILQTAGVQIVAWVESVGDICMPEVALSERDLSFSRQAVDANIVRCPHPSTATQMEEKIKQVRKQGDTIGGVIRCQVSGVPVGLGEPIFDRLEADLAKAMLAINASKGFEIGSGFEGTKTYGSRHNDPFLRDKDGQIRTSKNDSGGVQGGISNGMPLDFRVAFKPVATIMLDQNTVTLKGEGVQFKGRGRHDPCVLPRAVPIVESMAALVLCDHWLRHRSSRLSFPGPV